MSVGQFRRTQLDSYYESISFDLTTQETESNIETMGIKFVNPCVLVKSTTLTSQNNYYLKFKVSYREDSSQSFNVRIRNSNSEDANNYQNLRSYSVNQGIGSTIFEMVFSPNATYNQVVFELNRIPLDYTTENDDGTYGRLMIIEILEFNSLNNVIDYLSSSYSGLTKLNKIGIQGPPGLLMCINGEEIRIGRSGIYEINNNSITISFIGFILKESAFTQDGLDYFIMDFQY